MKLSNTIMIIEVIICINNIVDRVDGHCLYRAIDLQSSRRKESVRSKNSSASSNSSV